MELRSANSRRPSSSSNSNSHSYSTSTPPKVPPSETQGNGDHPTDAVRAMPGIPKLALGIKQVQATFDKRINARMRANERLTRRSALPHIYRIAMKDLPRALRNVERSLPEQDMQAANAITAHARGLIADPAGHVMPELSNDDALSADVRHVMECLQAAVAGHQEDGPHAEQERRYGLIDCLGLVIRNEFRSTPGRLAANAFNVTLRTGMVVGLSKLTQEALNFEVRKATELGEEASLRMAGIVALTLVPTLNVLGGLLSGALGTANRTSIISRLWLGTLFLGLVLACYEADVLDTLALKFGPAGVYFFVRDTCNFWFPLQDNVRSLSVPGVVASGGVYSMFNALMGLVIGKTVPNGGAGTLPRTDNATEKATQEYVAAAATAALDIPGAITYAGLAALVEIADDEVLPTILNWIETREYRKKEALNMHDEAAHSEYTGELIDFAKKLLKTPPKGRQQQIDDLNLDLYRREFRRMTKFSKDHQLDDAHRQYLESLRKELLVYQQTKIVREMWGKLSKDPNCYRAEQLAQLKSTEVALGVYTKTRELERLMSLDAGWINEEQRRDLVALQDQVDRDWEKWNELAPADQSKLNDDQKKLLRQLASEFASDVDLKPAKLRPMSRLQSDAQSTTLDFTRFPRMIKNTCGLHAPALTPKERDEIVEELFVYEFVRMHLPGPRLTAVEHEALASISKEDPRILPSKLLERLSAEVAEERRQGTEGLRIRLGFLPANVRSGVEFVERAGRQLLVTNAARFGANGVVYALLVLMDELIGDSIKDYDENTQLTIWGMIAGFGVFMVYWALILKHKEETLAGGGVYRPGVERNLPRLQERQMPEVLYTPRTERIRYEPDDRGISETNADYLARSESDSESDSVSEPDAVIELGALSTSRVWAE